MREILFKAKRLDNNEWVEGYYWTNLFNNHFIRIAQDKSGRFTIDDFEIDPNTLCQFTGLIDKDGNKIWENDIVDVSDCWWKLRDIERNVVEWDECKSGFYPYTYYNSEYDMYYYPQSSKVISNKFDNIELLKGGSQ